MQTSTLLFVSFFSDEGWKTVGCNNGTQQDCKRKRSLFTTSTPIQTSNRYSSLPTDNEDSVDSLEDIPDFNAFLTRVKRRRKRTKKSSFSARSSASDSPSHNVDASTSPFSYTVEDKVEVENIDDSSDFNSNAPESEYAICNFLYTASSVEFLFFKLYLRLFCHFL